jgi:heterodisulfide reductase subunit B
MLTKHTLCYRRFFKNKNIWKTKIKTKEYINRKNVNICIRNLGTNKERERKQMNIFERKVYRRILGAVYDNEKES